MVRNLGNPCKQLEFLGNFIFPEDTKREQQNL